MLTAPSATTGVIPEDPALPGLSVADPSRMLEMIRAAPDVASPQERDAWQSCTMTEAIYQPGRACRIAYSLGGDSDEQRSDLVYVRWDPLMRPHESGTMLHANGARCQVFRYPRDRRMRQIRSMRRDDWLREASASWFTGALGDGKMASEGWRCTPLKYVPESRLVCRLKARWLAGGSDQWVRAYVRISRRNDAERQFAILRGIRDEATKSAAPFDTPAPIGLIPSRHLLATEFIRGRSLRELAQEGSCDEVASVCGRLAQLHRNAPRPLLSPAVVSPQDLAVMLDDLSYHSAERSEICRDLGDWSSHRPTTPPAEGLVHGDLHGGQVILRKDRICVVDWDRTALGDATQDILNLAMDFSTAPWLSNRGEDYRAELATACVSAWRNAGGPWVDATARWWAVHSLVLRAWGFMRHLRPDWPSTTRHLLNRAQRIWRRGLEIGGA